MKRKILEYVIVREKVELINTMRKWGDGHPNQKSRMSSWNNKNERGESLRKFKKKGWFRYAGRVEILYVRRPLITCKEGQVDWWIKLQKMYAIKEITEKQVLRWYHKQTKKIYHSSWFYGCQLRNHRSVYSESEK